MRRRATEAVDGLETFLRVLLEIRNISPALPAVGVSILVHLRLQPEHSAKMGEVQKSLKISQQRTSQLCHSLARKGLLRLTPSTEDRRSVQVQLTEKSIRIIDR
jgi:DNA-binding MarR family transcriptional regulator